LLESAGNPKILWEEMKIVSQKAMEIQEKIMNDITAAERAEKDITVLQSLFDAREQTWDLMREIEKAAIALKDKTYTPATKKDGKSHEGHVCSCGCSPFLEHPDPYKTQVCDTSEDGCSCGCGCEEEHDGHHH
ncbi:MAG: hypothetical protein LBU87_04050, partial [Lactobacillales bacterium]|nr:hypothetical protein [Lactobacillales bacterium]